MADFVLAPLPPSEPHACLPLGPPLWTAEVESNEGRPASDATSQNPTFELVYWRFGLTLAARWRRRLGLPPVRAWQEVLARLCKPTARPLRGVPGAPPGYRPYERSSDAALISNGVAPQLFAAAFAPGERLGADAAALRNTLGATIAALLRNLPVGLRRRDVRDGCGAARQRLARRLDPRRSGRLVVAPLCAERALRQRLLAGLPAGERRAPRRRRLHGGRVGRRRRPPRARISA
mmetsp:Transcript_18209/g.60034  ORF Transcript_18209/g.60034 Transcript_18209/m.60034 type:complete len:235 (-) Transcript_18209:110-814(-)